MDDLRLLRAEKLRRLYAEDPEAYAADVLGVTWWSQQLAVAEAIRDGHKQIAVRASHGVGKSHAAAGIVNWLFDCHRPSITLTTAPTQAQVEDILWKEIRVQRKGRPGLQPKAPRLELAPNHFAAGYTAKTADSFQGRHEERINIIFDEAVGVGSEFFVAAESMMVGPDDVWLTIFNPTDVGSEMYRQIQAGGWHEIQISALEHPNVLAQLEGKPMPYKGAVSLDWVEKRLKKWCKPASATSRAATDIEWPPGSGKWYTPGPLFEGRVLGIWPSSSIDTVWSEALWNLTMIAQPIIEAPLRIGCDVARFGDDMIAMHVRRGRASLHHEEHNGWSTSATAGRLKALAKTFADPGEDPREVEIRVDDDGVGGGVTDQLDGWKVIPISAASTKIMTEPDDYPNMRSELWFGTRDRAEEERLDFTRLDEETKTELKRQATAAKYKYDNQGRRVVTDKDDMKKDLKRSPDSMDAVNLAYCEAGSGDWSAEIL